MNLNTIQQPLIEALGWTLLHSLWQGLIIAALLAVAIRLTKNKSPKLSYQLCCLSLLSLVVWMTSTFIAHFHWPVEGSSLVVNINPAALGDDFAFFTNHLSWQQNIDVFFQSFIQSYADELVMLWLLGVGVFGLKWVGTLYFTYALKRQNISSAPAEWQNMVHQFSRKLGINKTIKIVESTKVDVPMVIGYLKPVILMPASIATGFTSEQIESIIVHELAHIKSNDFLIGLILSAMEVILFYHPMYWWVSGIINEEREKHCDDIAVAQCGNPVLYARTLFSIAEQKQQRSLALSLQGKKNQLFDRIKRVCITPQGKTNTHNNKAGMALGLLFVIAIMALAQVPTQAKEAIFVPVKDALIEQFQPQPEPEEKVADLTETTINEAETTSEVNVEKNSNSLGVSAPEEILIDTIVPSNPNNVTLLTKLGEDGNIYITKKDTDGQAYSYIIRKGEGKIYINKKELELGNHQLSLTPDTEIRFVGTTLILDRDDIDLDNLDKVFDGDAKAAEQYYAEAKAQSKEDFTGRVKIRDGIENFEGIDEEIFSEEEERHYELSGEAREQQQEAIERHQEAIERQQEAIERQQEELERQQEAMERQEEIMERNREALERKREEMQEKMERQREEMEEKIEEQREEMERKREELLEKMEDQREEMERKREELHERRMEEEDTRREARNDQFHSLLSEQLYNDGLIKKPNKYKFKLTFSELKVNNKKQSSELHKKYLELYQNHYGTVVKKNSNVTIQRN